MDRVLRSLALAITGIMLLGAAPALGQESPSEPDAGTEPLALSPEGGPPVPGRYTDSSLGIDLGFTLGDEWVYGSSAAGFGVDLSLEGDGAPLFTISEINRALFERPCQAEGDETYWEEFADIEIDPETVIGHFAENPYIQTEGPTPVVVDGIEGLQLDASVALGRRCVNPDLPLWSSFYGEGETDYYTFTLADGFDARIIALEVDDKTVMIVMEAGGDSYDDLLDAAQPVVESLVIEGAAGPAE